MTAVFVKDPVDKTGDPCYPECPFTINRPDQDTTVGQDS